MIIDFKMERGMHLDGWMEPTTSDAIDGTEGDHQGVVGGERVEHYGNATKGDADHVQPQTIDEAVVGEVTKHQTTQRAEDADDRVERPCLIVRGHSQLHDSILGEKMVLV